MTDALNRSKIAPYAVSLVSGLLINASVFVPMLATQMITLFCVAPFLLLLLREQRLLTRAMLAFLFATAWQLPSSFWYFGIFPVWQAALTVLGNIMSLVLVVCLPGAIGIHKPLPQLIAIAILWTALVGIRMHAPATASWVVPNLTSTQWLNPLIAQFAAFGTPAFVVSAVIALNAVWVLLWKAGKNRALLIGALVAVTACYGFDFYLRAAGGPQGPAVAVIGIQAPLATWSPLPDAGASISDIERLAARTREAVGSYRAGETGNQRPVFVVWPENNVPEQLEGDLRTLAREESIFLAYHINRPRTEGLPYSLAVLISPDGQSILENAKRHAAPNEGIAEGLNFTQVSAGGLTVLADICYDLHFPDIGERLQGADLLLSPVDDDRFGDPFAYIHAADAVYRAIENRITIATASTNGASYVVRSDGLVVVRPLPLWAEESYAALVVGNGGGS